MLICSISESRKQFAEALDLLKFLTLLALGELAMIDILDAAGRIDADRLHSASGRRRYSNVSPGRRNDELFYSFKVGFFRNPPSVVIDVMEPARLRALPLPPLRPSSFF